MNRNFNRFLEAYCRELADVQTSNIRKLAALAASDRPRLREALLVFCLAQGKEQHLMKVMLDRETKTEYAQVIAAASNAPRLRRISLRKTPRSATRRYTTHSLPREAICAPLTCV